MNPFTALVYKEFRQQSTIWLALFVCAIVIQGLITLGFETTSNPPQGSVRVMVLCNLAWVLTTVYAFGSAGSVFVTEQEEKTYGFLRGLPIRRRTLFAAKIFWVIFGTISFVLCLALETFLWVWGTIPLTFGDFHSGVDLFIGVDQLYGLAILFCDTVLAAIIWGLFWSTRCRSQLFAMLATFTSGATVAALCKYYLGASDYELTTLLAVDIVIALLALYGAYYWFDRWVDRKSFLKSRGWSVPAQSSDSTASSSMNCMAATALYGRNPFIALTWQAVRQSGWLFRFAIAAGVACIVSRYFVEKNDNDTPYWFGFLGVFTVCVFCGSIFTADHRNNTVAMLGHRGLKPSTVWWSRIVAFGMVYFTCVTLFAAAVYYRYPVTEISWGLICFLSIPFWCGALISLFTPSPILSPCLTAAAWVGILCWGGIFTGAADAYNLEWWRYAFGLSTFPVLLGFMIASRLRIGDWLREKPLWRSRRPVVGFIVGPGLLLLATIPFIRVYSVPNIDLGFRVDPWELQHNEPVDPNVRKARFEAEQVIRSEDDLRKVTEAFRLYREAKRNPSAWAYRDPALAILSRLEYALQRTKNEKIALKHLDYVTPRFATEAIALLELMGEIQPNNKEQIRCAYISDYRCIVNDEIPAFFGNGKDAVNNYVRLWYRWAPWERIRALKLIHNDFQLQMRFAELTDNAIFENNGNLTELIDNYSDEYVRQRRLSWIWFPLALGEYSGFSPPSEVFNSEVNRRVLILRYAILKYGFEKNKMPESLDELVTAGILQQIPTQPNTGKPFEYNFRAALLFAQYCPWPRGYVPASSEQKRSIPVIKKRGFELERFPAPMNE